MVVVLLYPCDVEACLVAGCDFFYCIFSPASLRIGLCIKGFLSVVVAGYKVVQVVSFELIVCKGVLYPCTLVVEPYLFCRLSLGEEKYICFYSVGIEDAGGQSQDCVEVEF